MTPKSYQVLLLILILCQILPTSEGFSFFQDFLKTPSSSAAAATTPKSATISASSTVASASRSPSEQKTILIDQQEQQQPFTIAGLKPSNIASLLNTVSETGFSYFNVDNQCRSRTACDVGFMLYKKLNFVHNWIIRASVRTLVDSNNIYAQSWTMGMTGKNCTYIYPSCNQSPLESLMNFALLAG